MKIEGALMINLWEFSNFGGGWGKEVWRSLKEVIHGLILTPVSILAQLFALPTFTWLIIISILC